jgi:D-alanyl-D-alanine-carboxypeptidase/D-alanyl-D-alanine-endopeptidase
MKFIEPTQEHIHKLVLRYIRNQGSGLGFAIGCASPHISTQGKIFYEGSITNQYQVPIPLCGDSYFEIASITKTFTATLYAHLLPDKKITVGQFLGAAKIGSQFSQIPLSTLANYTSGLPEDNGSTSVMPPYWPAPYSVAGMLGFLNMTALTPKDNGREYTYSNLAFALLAHILTCVEPSCHSFEELICEKVLKPLGMKNTVCFGKVPLDRLPLGYLYSDEKPYAPTSPGYALFDAYYGAAGLVSTPEDMMLWLLFNMGITKNGLTSLLKELQKPSTGVTVPNGGSQLGLGWFIQKGGTIFKDGELDGFNSYMAFIPSSEPGKQPSQAGVFVLTNASVFKDPDGMEAVVSIANDLLLLMQGQEPSKDRSLYGRASFASIAGAELRSSR